MTTRISTDGLDAYVIVGFYDNDQPGEIFVKVAKQGSFINQMFDTVSLMASKMLQSGFSLDEVLTNWENRQGDKMAVMDEVAKATRRLVSERGGKSHVGYHG